MLTEMLNIRQVKVNDPFWSGRIQLVIDRALPYQWWVLNDQEPDAEPSYAIANFRIAAGLDKGEFRGFQFQDSDLAKWIEGASYSLLYRDDPELRKNLKDTIELIGKAQQPDGYLDTHYIVKKPEQKWREMAHGHELYCAGHMLEAAVAYQLVTGDDSLMRIMDRLVDLIESKFGLEEGKTVAYPGHEEIELALMKAYRLTGKEKYRKLAEFFILNRGRKPGFFDDPAFIGLAKREKAFDASYYQAHLPVLEQETAEGHAVRAMYLFTGMSDVAAAAGNQELKETLKKLWANVTQKRMYITGGIGSQSSGERFTIDYDLPNDTCYTETCAAIGLAMWSLRMLALEPRAEYADIMERALYNNVLSGISQDGEHYFYVNPLMLKPDVARFRADQKSVAPSRVKWFPCACCPPNVIRTLTGLGQYLYTRQGRRIYQHLYIGNDTEAGDIRLQCASRIPWEGAADIRTAAKEPFELALRIPEYARDFTVCVNGRQAAFEAEYGYAILSLRGGDEVNVRFDMPPRVMLAHPRVTEDCGKACVVRGPLVYCAEEADNGPLLQDFILNPAEGVETVQSDWFGGIQLLRVHGTRTTEDGDTRLYRPYEEVKRQAANLTLVPYFLWNNRGEGEMTVWMNTRES